MKRKISGLIAASVALLLGSASIAEAKFNTPTIDGAGIDTTNYRQVYLQTAEACFGPKAYGLYVANDATNLYIAIPGNLGSDAFHIFLDTKAGGSADVATNTSGGYGEFDDLAIAGGGVMPTGFLVDYVINAKPGGDTGVWDVQANTAAYKGNEGAPSSGYNINIDDSNTSGVASAALISTGYELQIPLADVGLTVGKQFKIFLVSGNAGKGGNPATYMANQILPATGLATCYGNDGAGGAAGNGLNFNGTGGPNITPTTLYTYQHATSGYSATGAGISYIGPGGDYLTLKAANDSVNIAGSRDASTWIFEFVGNTTEPANTPLSIPVDPAGKILYRPDSGITASVTFTNNLDNNPGASGNFMIGATTTLDWPAASLGTKNIEIDGSNNGSTSRDLTFTNSGITIANQGIIVMVGDVDNCVFKNLIVTNTTTGGASSSAITARPRLTGANNMTPDGWLIDNCVLTSTTSTQGVAVNVTNSGTLTAGNAANGFTVRNSQLNARIRGFFGNFAYGYTFDNNIITVGTTAAVSGTDTFGIYNFTSNTPPANTTTIKNNRIYVSNAGTLAVTQGPFGINMSTTGTGYDRVVEIFNNEVTVVNTGNRNASISSSLRGISTSSGVTTRIYHNTVYIPDNAGSVNSPASSTSVMGIGGMAAANHNVDIRGNIIIVEENNVNAICQNVLPSGAGSGFASNWNIIYTVAGANAGRRVATNYATLALYSAASGTDAQSDAFNPLSSMVDTNLTGGVDLKLVAGTYPASQWGSLPVALVTTDYAGTTRSAVRPFRGFHELATPTTAEGSAPTAIALSPSSVAENSAAATVVGALTATDDFTTETIAFVLTDSASGTFAATPAAPGTNLTVASNTLLNYEVNPSLNVTVKAIDESFNEFSAIKTVTITNANDAPTDIALSNNTIAENSGAAATIGTLSTTDADTPDTHTYTLVAGTGSTDNAAFTITGNTLSINANPNFEAQSSYSVRVRSTDAGTAFTEKAFAITITNLLECVYDFTNASQNVAAAGGNVNVPVTNGENGCTWFVTETPDVAWIDVTTSSSTTNGNAVISVSANVGPARSATLTLTGGDTITINQDDGCVIAFGAANTSLNETSHLGQTVSVTTSDSACAWTASTSDGWISIVSGTGTGNGTVTFDVAANSGAARVGTINLTGGDTYTVNQDGLCSYTVQLATYNAPVVGVNDVLATVTTSLAGCDWSAVSNDAWLTVDAPTTGTGTGTFTYDVASNAGKPARTGTITVVDQTITVNQPDDCSTTYTLASQSITRFAQTGLTAGVSASDAGCAWTASTVDSWITITTNSGSGNGSVVFDVTANPAGTPRVGTITLSPSGAVHTITQDPLNTAVDEWLLLNQE